MPASNRRDLFLQVSASTDNMQAALKAGRSELARTGAAAVSTSDEIQKAFVSLGGGSIEETARSLESAYNKAFANIRSNLQKVADAPTPQIAVGVINAAGAEQAAAAAEAQAAGLRMVADAAERAAASDQDGTSATKIYALAQRAAATGAEEMAVALRQQAVVLGSVQRELGIAADAEDEVAGSHQRMGASGLIAEHVVRSFSDSLAAGQSPIRAATMEVGRITEAVSLFAMTTDAGQKGALGTFARFMGGPWGLAIQIGVAVLTPLIGKLFETDDAAAKAMAGLKEFEAKELDLPNLIDKTTGKLKDQVAALQNLGTVASQVLPGRIQDARQDASGQAFLGFKAARDKVSEEGSTRAGPRDAQLSQAIYGSGGSLKALDASIQKMLPTRPDLAPLARTVADYLGKEMEAIAKVQDLQGQKYGLDVLHRPGGSLLTADSVKRHADEVTATSPAQKAQLRVKDAEDRVDSIGKEPPSPAQQAMLARAEADLIAAKRTLQQVQAAANDQKGRPIDLGGAEAIVRSIGGTITSAVRTTGQQQVLYDKYQAFKAGTGPWAPMAAKPGNSQHETGHALDIAMTPGMTLEKIIAAFKAQGVNLTQHYDEGNHFHVAWSQKGPSQETLDKRQQAAVSKGANIDKSFQSELAQSQAAIARAALGDVLTPDQSGAIDRTELFTGYSQKRAERADDVTAGRRSQAQVDQLNDNDATAEELAEINSLTKQRLADANKQVEDEQQQLADGMTLMQLQSELATTSKERRDIALRMLADEETRSRLPLQSVLDHPELHTKDEVAKAQTGMDAIAAQHAARVAEINRRDADPIQSYKNQLQSNVGDMNTALHGVAVDGLKGVEDGLTGILDGTESVSSAFKKMATSILADLARVAAEKAIFALLGLKDGGKASVGGSVLGYADGGLPGFATGGIPGFATGASATVLGGIIRGPGTGRSDSILALVGGRKPIMISNGEGIVNEKAVKQWWPEIDAMNKGTFAKFASGGLVSPNRIYMRGLPSSASIQKSVPGGTERDVAVHVTPSPYFDVAVARVASPMAQRAIIGGAQQAAEDRHDEGYSAIPQ